MSDYMKSLHVRFRWEPELQKVRKELKRTYRETKAGLDQQDQETLPPLVNLENELREAVEGSASLQKVVNAATKLIGYPIAMIDMNHNVLSRPPAEAKAKLKAATEETKSLAVIKVERYTADAWMNSSKTMQKSK